MALHAKSSYTIFTRHSVWWLTQWRRSLAWVGIPAVTFSGGLEVLQPGFSGNSFQLASSMPCVCCMSMCVCVAAGSRRQSLSKSWLLLKGQLSPAQPIYLPPPPAPIPGWRAHEESEAVWITVFPWLGDQDEIILVKPRSPRYHWIIWLFPPWRESYLKPFLCCFSLYSFLSAIVQIPVPK